MLVKATQLGYYGNIRIREGQKFRLESKKEFSDLWMIDLSKSKKKNVEDDVIETSQPEPAFESPLVQESEEEQVTADNNSDVI